jgi:hypothetical protein
MLGDLPPSSSEIFLTLQAAARMIVCPVGTLPVKAILSTSMLSASAAPATGPAPGSTLSTPSGKPASVASFASHSAESGVYSDGLRMQTFPAASAGASFQTPSAADSSRARSVRRRRSARAP